MWICDECESYNDEENKICNICGAERPNIEYGLGSSITNTGTDNKGSDIEYSFYTPVVKKKEFRPQKDDWYTEPKATVVSSSKVSSSPKKSSAKTKYPRLFRSRFSLYYVMLIVINIFLAIVNTINIIGVL